MSDLNYAERAVLLDRIETLQAELFVERALNAKLQAGLDILLADIDVLKAELRRSLSDAMTDHEVRTLGLEHTPAGLVVRT